MSLPKSLSNVAELRQVVELICDFVDGSPVNDCYSALSEVNYCSKYINRMIFRKRNETSSK